MSEPDEPTEAVLTEAAVRVMTDFITKTAGDTLVRHALRRIVRESGLDKRERNSLIYMALMAATDAGIECGIRVQYKWNLIEGCFAVFHLWDGNVAFEIDEDWSTVDEDILARTPDRVTEFLDMKGHGDDGIAQGDGRETII